MIAIALILGSRLRFASFVIPAKAGTQPPNLGNRRSWEFDNSHCEELPGLDPSLRDALAKHELAVSAAGRIRPETPPTPFVG